MLKFHSIVSRRDFMKGLGLAGAGLGAVSLVAPTFHDLDEVIASPESNWKRAWWVKEVEEPTVEIDWGQMQRIDQRTTTQAAYVNAQYAGVSEWKDLLKKGGDFFAAQYKGGKGNTLRDYALAAGAFQFMKAWPTAPIFTNSTFLGPTAGVSIVTPESLGMPKWQGSPEENTRMMRAAARFYGAGQIGGAELHQKLVFTYIKHGSKSTANDNPYMDVWPPPLTAGPKIEFINEDIGYETEAVKYLPDRHLTEVGVMIPMAREAWRTADPEHGSQIANAANISRYRMWACSVQPGLQAFLRGLGYHGYGYPFPDMSGGLVPSLASAVLGGISEMGRSSEIGLNPEVGSVGGYYSLLTDLPMAEDKPIDAGLFRFCHTCHKCANSCPADAISQDGEPTWDIPNFGYKVPQMNMMGGKRLFWTDTHACARYRVANPCIICRPTCTFNVNDAASVHEIIHGTVATTSVLNGFFWGMSKTFGYGLKDPDEWWDMSLPMWGTDSTAFANNGGYK